MHTMHTPCFLVLEFGRYLTISISTLSVPSSCAIAYIGHCYCHSMLNLAQNIICIKFDPYLCKNEMKYIIKQKHGAIEKIELQFINSKHWKLFKCKMEINWMVDYLWEEKWRLHAFWIVLQWGSGAFLSLRNKGKP